MLPVCRPNRGSYVVGYTTKAAVEDSVQVGHPTVGSMFVSVGSTDTFKLGDITMTTKDGSGNRVNGGGYMTQCMLMVIDPATSRVDNDKRFLYWGDAEGAGDDDRGWYNYNDEDTLVNDETFPAGTALLCNFATSKEVQLTFAGQVLTGNVTIDSEIKGVVYGHPYVVNPFPVDITLGDIEMKTVNPSTGAIQDGGGYMTQCMLMVVDAETSRVDNDKRFLYWGDAEGAGEDDHGWYNYNDEDTLVNETPVKAGEGFLCNFATSLKPKLIFKNPIK